MSQHIIVKARMGLYTDDTHCIKIMGNNKYMVCDTTAELRNDRQGPIRVAPSFTT